MSKRRKTLPERRTSTGEDDETRGEALVVVTLVWSHIEPCLRIEDTIRVAQTCMSLHRKIADPQTRKVKVSHLVDISGEEKIGGDAQARYLMHALRCVHFPSLRRLRYPPLMFSGRMPKELSAQCFTAMAMGLGYATNLEELHLLSEGFVDSERENPWNPWRLDLALDMLGYNLSLCKSLKALYIKNNTSFEPTGPPGSIYCVGLYAAVTRGMASLELEKFTVSCGTNADDQEAEESNEGHIIREFFAAILKQLHLKSLYLYCTGEKIAIKLLLDVCGDGRIAALPQLEKLTLDFPHDSELRLDDRYKATFGEGMYERDCTDLTHLVEQFLDCSMLKVVNIKFPCGFWERADLSVFKPLFAEKLRLRGIYLSFGKSEDQCNAVMKQVIESVNSDSLEYVILEELKDCSSALLRDFVKKLKGIGLREWSLDCQKFDGYTSDLDSCSGEVHQIENWEPFDVHKDKDESSLLVSLVYTRSGTVGELQFYRKYYPHWRK